MIRKTTLHEKVICLAIAMIAFFYVAYATFFVWIDFFNVNQANLIMRAVVFVLFISAILMQTSARLENFRILWPLYVFYLIYGFRVLSDIFLRDIVFFQQTSFYILTYLFALTMIPLIVIGIGFRVSYVNTLHKYCLYFLVIANVMLLAFALTNDLVTDLGAAGARAQVDGEVVGTAVINPITVSQIGAMLAVFALGRLAVDRGDRKLTQVVLLGFAAIGVYNVLLGGSRGPVVSLVLGILVIFYVFLRSVSVSSTQRTGGVVVLYLAVIFGAVAYQIVYFDTSLYIVDRMLEFFQSRREGGLEERDFQWYQALRDFEMSPFFGESYVSSIGAGQPHNIILEAMMATGIFGMLFFIPALLIALFNMGRVIHGAGGAKAFPMVLVTLCMLVTGLLSGSLGQFPELWVFLVVMTIIGRSRQAPSSASDPVHPAMARPDAA